MVGDTRAHHTEGISALSVKTGVGHRWQVKGNELGEGSGEVAGGISVLVIWEMDGNNGGWLI